MAKEIPTMTLAELLDPTIEIKRITVDQFAFYFHKLDRKYISKPNGYVYTAFVTTDDIFEQLNASAPRNVALGMTWDNGDAIASKVIENDPEFGKFALYVNKATGDRVALFVV